LLKFQESVLLMNKNAVRSQYWRILISSKRI